MALVMRKLGLDHCFGLERLSDECEEKSNKMSTSGKDLGRVYNGEYTNEYGATNIFFQRKYAYVNCIGTLNSCSIP